MSPYTQGNRKAALVIFTIVQLIFLLITYGLIYTAFVGTKLAIAEYHFTGVALAPSIFATFFYPYVLFRCRKIYLRGNTVLAVAWMMSWSSLIIVLLYAFLSRLVGG